MKEVKIIFSLLCYLFYYLLIIENICDLSYCENIRIGLYLKIFDQLLYPNQIIIVSQLNKIILDEATRNIRYQDKNVGSKPRKFVTRTILTNPSLYFYYKKEFPCL